MSEQKDRSLVTEADLEKPEFISLATANMADLSCPGCKVTPIDDEEDI